MKVFKKVMVSDRLPKESGMQITNKGILHFLSGCGRFMGHEPQWWLEEIELPSDEDICNEGFDNSMCSISFSKGANYILNKLK